MAKLRLIDRWATITDAELLALVGALDLVEAHAPVDCAPLVAESLSDEIGDEIQRRGAKQRGRRKRLPTLNSWARRAPRNRLRERVLIILASDASER